MRQPICARLLLRRQLYTSTATLRQLSKPDEPQKRVSPIIEPEQKRSTSQDEPQHKWQRPEENAPFDRKRFILYTSVAGFGLGLGTLIRKFFVKESEPSHDTSKFVTVELVSKEEVSSTASIFTVKLKHDTIKAKKDSTLAAECEKAWKTGIWNVEFKQPQIQIVRAYTPLPPFDAAAEQGAETLKFLIRKDARGGEMSSYLHRLPVGATIEVRGPNVEYVIPETAKNVVFVAGGTGIAPALQVAHAMFAGRKGDDIKDKKLHILWGNRKREDCAGGFPQQQVKSAKATEAGISSWGWNIFGPRVEKKEQPPQAVTELQPNAIVEQLQSLSKAYGDRVSVSYFVDEEKTFITSTNLEHALSSKAQASTLGLSNAKSVEDTNIIISGPPGFITYIAGPKVWQDGEEKQGPLGGRLAQILGKDSKVKVWKV